jgi:hypothetical protein
LAVVTELREWLGLRNADAESPTPTVTQTKPAIPKDSKGVETATTPEESQEHVNKIWLGPNEKGETPQSELACCLLEEDVDSGRIERRDGKVQLINMSVYGKLVYLKLSICNSDYRIARLRELFVWYTAGAEESVNWAFSNSDASKPLFQLKPGECRVVGGWSDEVQESFKLIPPVGQLFYSKDKDYGSRSIDLAGLERQGFLKIYEPRSR